MPRIARRDIFALQAKQIRYVLRTRYIASQFDMLTPRCQREEDIRGTKLEVQNK